MKERPILFSGPMVRAILEDRKTQTRRIVKLPHNNSLGGCRPTTIGGENGGKTAAGETVPLQGAIWHVRTGDFRLSPHGQPGDRLWVRETHEVRRIGTETFEGGRPTRRYAGIAYQADDGRAEVDIDLNTFQALDAKESRGWTPSIHMPRWASRITLEITGVRAERLQSISKADAIAEGMATSLREHDACVALRDDYRALWDGLNAARGHGWDVNPWVWAIEFRRIK
ncbi:Phage-related protein [Burkholderia cenocepacia H111]|uniref:hypothetical protein n=1 Tax=Burkholderia cenocepacia TaxID=95486 RepID=UPI000234367D|nr:hypothetical protein [Burkholderia cenocepacia]CDN59996.1 Phage-related protein [Burkholderia cenocepacia H111]